MKKITTILTALILMFTLTFTTGCIPLFNAGLFFLKKDGGIDPNKTTKDVVIENDWKFTKGSALRTSGTLDVTDTIVSFEPDTLIIITPNKDTANFKYTNYTIKDDSVNATLVFRVAYLTIIIIAFIFILFN